MLDIDFLTDRPTFDGPLIYRYRSGVLRSQVRAALAEIVEQEGRELIGCERDEFASILRGSLFVTHTYWCDWTALTPSSVLKAQLDTILTRMIARADRRSALFVPFESPLSARPLWAEVEEAAGLVLVEEPVKSAKLLPALRLFQATSDLVRGADLLADSAFVASFDLFKGRKRRSLLELSHDFDIRVATCVDPATRTFNPDVYHDIYPDQAQAQARGASALSALRRLLTDRRGWDRFELVRALDERHMRDGWTAHAVIGELHRITATILAEPVHPLGLGGARAFGGVDCVLWAALLLSWDGHLRAIAAADASGYRRQPDGLVTAIDELGREFLARADLDSGADPLAAAWAGLDEVLMRIVADPTDRLASVRMATAEALHRYLRRATLEINWLQRLDRRVRRAIDEAKVAEAERHDAEIKAERAAQDADAEKARVQIEPAAITQAFVLTQGGR